MVGSGVALNTFYNTIQGVADPSHVMASLSATDDSEAPGKPEVTPMTLSHQSNDADEKWKGGGTVACGIFNRTFAVYSSLVSFFIPLAIMIFADIRSIQVLALLGL